MPPCPPRPAALGSPAVIANEAVRIQRQRPRWGQSSYGARLFISAHLGGLLLVTAACDPATRASQAGRGTDDSFPPIDAVIIHPPVAAEFVCSEHPLGAEDHAGDALAVDCYVVRRDAGPFENFPHFYARRTEHGTRTGSVGTSRSWRRLTVW
jgi:hypothetical protein